ncbi:sigma-70 family RNA polymerase sigma factor [Corynebacterium diphtheriae bv. mitis]|uniref:RNA polymerase sigma factor n=1 Tax=Corynebacterium diphtheriae TaxID=1717 RepID=UPI0018C9A75E|nr:sigma-70 family RNA polymerase sigma factor [Corynebacterium diphtheriae]MBG9276811.1 sigma-70 family RNA polymerase sigma factor [Corynebacterium diphtheriae bv. mitis]MBG9281109.1 sigma-70 family RNA polymerase sigma factor [Corynebacterium diphtheriae bv. mitis]
MTTQPNRRTSEPYSVRTKKVGGKVYTQIYVPSTVSKDGTQNYAWIELVDPPTGDKKLGLSGDEVLALLYDQTYVSDWKIAYLREAYLEFRAMENARNRSDVSYSDWEVEVHDGPQYLNVSVHEEQIDSELVVDWLLSQVSAKQADHIRLHVFEGLSFVQIARDELLGAGEADVTKRANSIGRSVKRALKKLREFIEQECPDLAPGGGV